MDDHNGVVLSYQQLEYYISNIVSGAVEKLELKKPVSPIAPELISSRLEWINQRYRELARQLPSRHQDPAFFSEFKETFLDSCQLLADSMLAADGAFGDEICNCDFTRHVRSENRVGLSIIGDNAFYVLSPYREFSSKNSDMTDAYLLWRANREAAKECPDTATVLGLTDSYMPFFRLEVLNRALDKLPQDDFVNRTKILQRISRTLGDDRPDIKLEDYQIKALDETLELDHEYRSRLENDEIPPEETRVTSYLFGPCVSQLKLALGIRDYDVRNKPFERLRMNAAFLIENRDKLEHRHYLRTMVQEQLASTADTFREPESWVFWPIVGNTRLTPDGYRVTEQGMFRIMDAIRTKSIEMLESFDQRSEGANGIWDIMRFYAAEQENSRPDFYSQQAILT